MMARFGYCIGEQTKETLASDCNDQGFHLDQTFVDDPASRCSPWFARPAGQVLASRLSAGDMVIVPDGDTIYSGMSDLLAVLQYFHERDNTLHLIRGQKFLGNHQYPLTIAGEVSRNFTKILEKFISWNRSRRGDAIRSGMWTKRQMGLKHCYHPPYGYRFEKGKPVRNEEELAVMDKIVELKHAGQSYYRIAAKLLRERVLTPAGEEWSPARVRRAYQAAIRYKAFQDANVEPSNLNF
jgi:hypothetical protein